MKAFHLPACLIALLFNSCASTGRQDAPARLSGRFVFTGLGERHADEFPNPLIDFSEIAPGSEVLLTHTGDTLEARYLSRSGKTVTRALVSGAFPKETRWQDGALLTSRRVPIEDGFILPGAARQYRGSRIQLDPQGRLRITGAFMEKGMMLYLIPFTDRQESELLLIKRRS